MDDLELIELYFARDERALRGTEEKYGRLCLTIAGNLLARREDAEECVNDAYLALWNAIPPQRPLVFSAYLARITRNLALKKWEQLSARKRNPAALTSFEELDDCLSGGESPENEVEARQIKELIDRFLWQQSEERRNVFIRRYWYFDSVKSIAGQTGFTQNKVKSILYDMRRKLRACLESEGIEL